MEKIKAFNLKVLNGYNDAVQWISDNPRQTLGYSLAVIVGLIYLAVRF